MIEIDNKSLWRNGSMLRWDILIKFLQLVTVGVKYNKKEKSFLMMAIGQNDPF